MLENILKKYSYAFIGISTAVLIFAVGKIITCPPGVDYDLCKLGGVAYWNFYGFPTLLLGLGSLAIPKLTESKAAKAIMLGVLVLVTIQAIRIIVGF
jgi:hypothetical protein